MVKSKIAVVDSVEVPVEGERKLIGAHPQGRISSCPTFCYHSDISVYGRVPYVHGRGGRARACPGLLPRPSTTE